ncbi:MAG: hypothetical protein ACO1ON_12860 [Nocardioides sp.]
MKIYEVLINGVPHTMRFADGEQPEGAQLVEAKQAPAVKNKARTTRSKKSED